MNPSGYIIPAGVNDFNAVIYVEPSSKNSWKVTSSGNGYITIDYDLVVSGMLDSTWAAPHINGTFTFRVNKDGSIDYEFDRDGFPWAEAYYFDAQGKVHIIFQDPAVRGSPYDLFAIEPDPDPLTIITKPLQGLSLGDPINSSQDNLSKPGTPC